MPYEDDGSEEEAEDKEVEDEQAEGEDEEVASAAAEGEGGGAGFEGLGREASEEVVRVMLSARQGVNALAAPLASAPPAPPLLAPPIAEQVAVVTREQRLLAEAAEQLREVDDDEDWVPGN